MASKNNDNVVQPTAADSEAKEVSEQRYSLENLQRHCRPLPLLAQRMALSSASTR